MKSRKLVGAMVGLMLVAAGAIAWDEVNMSVEGLNVKGSTFKIDGTAFTGTAAQLNALVGGTTSSALAPAYLLVGNATSNAAAVAVSGDLTCTTSGAFTVGSSKITSAKIVDLTIVDGDISASAAIALTKLGAVAPAYVIVGNASSQAVAVAVSGDVTISNAGAVTIGANKVVTGMILDGTILADDMSASLYTGWVTNSSTLSTNIIKYYHGVVTNVTLNP